MSKITKVEFTEVDRSVKNKYSIYVSNEKCYIEYKIIGSLNNSNDKIIISNDEYELIINHLLKYYKILSWKNVYENKDFSISNNEWSLLIYNYNEVNKEIIGFNNYPKNYNSFKNYIVNKYNTLKIKY